MNKMKECQKKNVRTKLLPEEICVVVTAEKYNILNQI